MTNEPTGLHGLLVIDKPEGPTSHDIVARVRRSLRERRVGHAGTLDPFATGVLVCAVGRATRLLRWFSGSDKTYEGVVRFGFATDTGDRTGRALGECHAPDFDRAQLDAAIARLSGDILQVPPMYSAKKRDGVSLHRLARRGIEVAREAVPCRVRWDATRELDAEGRLRFRVTCSAGTYVRVLASDLGELVGCPAHLEELRRVEAGPFHVSAAIDADALEPGVVPASLIPMSEAPLPLPRVVLDDAAHVDAFVHGRVVELAGEDGEVAVMSQAGALLGVARRESGRLRAVVVLAES